MLQSVFHVLEIAQALAHHILADSSTRAAMPAAMELYTLCFPFSASSMMDMSKVDRFVVMWMRSLVSQAPCVEGMLDGEGPAAGVHGCCPESQLRVSRSSAQWMK
jgi:hypothetical protein